MYVVLNERVSFLDVCFGPLHFRVFAVYMPHGGYPDTDVEEIYAVLEAELILARQKSLCCILAGDLNAEIGCRTHEDDNTTVGTTSFGERNDRGEWLVKWATTQGLAIVQSHFSVLEERLWTYSHGDVLKQLDYFLIDQNLLRRVVSVDVEDLIDIGSAHRPISMSMQIEAGTVLKRKVGLNNAQMCLDISTYQSVLNSNVSTYPYGQANWSLKSEFLEKALLNAAMKANVHDTRGKSVQPPSDDDLRIKELISLRRSLRSNTALSSAGVGLEKTNICKEIQKLVRRRRRLRKEKRIGRILHDFVGTNSDVDICGWLLPKTIQVFDYPVYAFALWGMKCRGVEFRFRELVFGCSNFKFDF